MTHEEMTTVIVEAVHRLRGLPATFRPHVVALVNQLLAPGSDPDDVLSASSTLAGFLDDEAGGRRETYLCRYDDEPPGDGSPVEATGPRAAAERFARRSDDDYGAAAPGERTVVVRTPGGGETRCSVTVTVAYSTSPRRESA